MNSILPGVRDGVGVTDGDITVVIVGNGVLVDTWELVGSGVLVAVAMLEGATLGDGVGVKLEVAVTKSCSAWDPRAAEPGQLKRRCSARRCPRSRSVRHGS